MFVDYRSLDVRHLGDIYEGLLDHARYAEVDTVAVADGESERWLPAADAPSNAMPRARVAAGRAFLATGKGERRSNRFCTTRRSTWLRTWSTRASVFAPEPMIESGRPPRPGRRNSPESEGVRSGDGVRSLPSISYDLARALTRLDVDDLYGGSPTDLQVWRRKVVERCVYGVDQNPLAVELAKLSLWLATVSLDRPLSFLDNHLVHGNSLLGTNIEALGSLMTAPASGQAEIFEESLNEVLPQVRDESNRITAQVSETVEDVQAKEALLQEARTLMQPFRHVAICGSLPDSGRRLAQTCTAAFAGAAEC